MLSVNIDFVTKPKNFVKRMCAVFLISDVGFFWKEITSLVAFQYFWDGNKKIKDFGCTKENFFLPFTIGSFKTQALAE